MKTMNDITELINDPIVQQVLYIIGVIGILFIGCCVVITVGDSLFQLYEYLQRRRNEYNERKTTRP